VEKQVSIVWPASGLALAAVLIFGYRVWPGIAAGALGAYLSQNQPLPVAAAIATGNTLEPLVGAWLLWRVIRIDISLERLRDVLGLMVMGGALATMIAATIGATAVCADGGVPWSRFEAVWFTWWVGDGQAILLVAPFVLTWSRWTGGIDWRVALESACL